MTMRTRAVLAALATVSVAALAACGSTAGSADGGSGADTSAASPASPLSGVNIPAPDPNGDLAKSAKSEGQLVWYAPALGGITDLAAAFTKQYHIKINIVQQNNVQLQSRFTAEAKSGKPASDVVTTGYTSFFPNSLAAGYLTPLNKALDNFPGQYPSEFAVDNQQTAVIIISTVGIAYDTTKVSAPPTDWKDLADPKYKGKLVSVDPTASAGYVQFWDALLTKYGTDTVSAIGKNITRTFAQVPAEMQSLTSGEGEIALYSTAGLTAPVAAKGAPVKFTQFDFTTGVNFATGITAKAAHPNAAKLFTEWLLSTPGQQDLNTINKSSTPLVPSSLPSQYTPPQLTVSDARKQEIFSALGVKASG